MMFENFSSLVQLIYMHRIFETLQVDCVQAPAIQLNKPSYQGQRLLIPLVDNFFFLSLISLGSRATRR